MFSKLNRSTVWSIKLAVLFVLSFAASAVSAATLSVSPDTAVHTAGGTFTATVLLNTQGEAVNAAEGRLTFDPKKLSVVAASRNGSIFNLWTQEPTFSNSAGTISFGGGSPGGYTGGRGTVMTVTFRAANAGTAKVTFTDGSVLAADGRGTNILTNMNGGSYTISAAQTQPEPEEIEYVPPPNTPGTPTITSPTHPDSEKWYTAKEATLNWTLPSGITAVRTLLDSNPGSVPTKVYDDPITTITLSDLDEGQSYFHLQFRNAEGWGRVAHYRLAIDSVGPTTFNLSLPDNADIADPAQEVAVEFTDDTSGLSHIVVEVDGGEPFEITELSASSTFTLPELPPGKHSVVAEAFDRAGNSVVDRLSFTIVAFDKPVFTEYPTSLNEGVIPVLKGQTRPNATVEVSLQKGSSDTPTITTVEADASGEFIYIPEGTLSLGVYTVTAVAFDTNGAQSEPSEAVKIAVQQPGYVAIGSLMVSVLSIVVPLVALVFLLLFVIWYSVHRLRRFRGKVATESKEALEMLQKEFGELREVLHKGEASLIDSRKTKKLTKAESELLSLLHTEINDSESRVEKEITDVTSLTKSKTKK